jgi:hypothetical protein
MSSNLYVPIVNGNNGKICSSPYPPNTIAEQSASTSTSTTPSVLLYNDKKSITLDNTNSNYSAIYVDNTNGNKGVTTIYVDTTSKVGSLWNVVVVYNSNIGPSSQPTSAIATFGLNNVTIHAIANISDGSTAIKTISSDVTIDGPDTVDASIDSKAGTGIYGLVNNAVYSGSITSTDIISPPSEGLDTSGASAISKYGLVTSTIVVIYVSNNVNGTPTFFYKINNSYNLGD